MHLKIEIKLKTFFFLKCLCHRFKIFANVITNVWEFFPFIRNFWFKQDLWFLSLAHNLKYKIYKREEINGKLKLYFWYLKNTKLSWIGKNFSFINDKVAIKLWENSSFKLNFNILRYFRYRYVILCSTLYFIIFLILHLRIIRVEIF